MSLDWVDRLAKGIASGGMGYLLALCLVVIGALARAYDRQALRHWEEWKEREKEAKAEAKAAGANVALVLEATRTLSVLGDRLMAKQERLEATIRERLPRAEKPPRPPRVPPLLGPEPPTGPGKGTP